MSYPSDGVSLFLTSRQQRNHRAFLGEQVGSTLADSAVSSGYYRYLVGKSVSNISTLSSVSLMLRAMAGGYIPSRPSRFFHRIMSFSSCVMLSRPSIQDTGQSSHIS